MFRHKSSNLDPAVEQRLRDEARSTGQEGPSPYLHTRIMAEVSSLHAEKMGRTRWRWMTGLVGALSVVLILLIGLARLGDPRGGGGLPPGTNLNLPPAQVASTDQTTIPLAQELQTTVNDPFKAEIESLGTDAKRAAAFLGACLPL